MKLGSVFEQTSNVEFVAMLDPEQSGERLLFSYLELDPDGGEPRPDRPRIIARVKSIHKENPLLSRDQAGISASIDTSALPVEYSQRFTYGWAECSVVGEMTAGGYLDMNKRVIPPNAEVHTPHLDTLTSLFSSGEPSHLPLGTIDTFGDEAVEAVPVTTDGDAMATKHFCIFGQTGTGKTNTSAKLLEEYLARGQRMVIFDPHDDYENLDNYANLLSYKGLARKDTSLDVPMRYRHVLRRAKNELNIDALDGQSVVRSAFERLARTASVIYENEPARNFFGKNGSSPRHDGFNEGLLDALEGSNFWENMLQSRQVRGGSMFPELRNYGSAHFTVNLFEAFRGRAFTEAGREWLVENIDQNGRGLDYLENLDDEAASQYRNALEYERNMLRAVRSGISGVMSVYGRAVRAGASPFDLEDLLESVAHRGHRRSEAICRLSLSDLSSNLRKATVYGVVEYFFREFKYGNYRVRGDESGPANALPVLFVLEEARSLIPNSSASEESDIAGNMARRAMRRIAYEGRKFSLGYGLVSQKPSTVDQEVTSQANTFILHQLKSPNDQQYVRKVTESMSGEELDMIAGLGTGRALISGLAVQSPVLLNVFFRYSKEGIEAPTPLEDRIGSAVQEARSAIQQSQSGNA